jgi:segregation and condensation protein B
MQIPLPLDNALRDDEDPLDPADLGDPEPEDEET